MKQLLLTDNEIQALVNLIDAGVKHTGIAQVENAAYLLGKLKAAEEVKEPESKALKAVNKKDA
jgi:hypothetical protein